MARHVAYRILSDAPGPELPREYDPDVVVHSTPLNRFPSIVSAGAILPSVTLQRTRSRARLVGFADLGEPADYIEFVHFSELGSATGEVIVLSQRDREWTPRSFAEDADAEFSARRR